MKKLRILIVFVLVIGTLIPVLGSYYVLIEQQAKQQLQTMLISRQKLLRHLSQALSEALWSYQHEHIRTILSLALLDDGNLWVNLRDGVDPSRPDYHLVRDGPDTGCEQRDLDTPYAVLSETVMFNGKTLGEIELGISDCYVRQSLQQSYFQIGMVLGAQFLLTVLLVLVLLYSRVSKPLQRVLFRNRIGDMRDLLRNIAHQWRQPLMALSAHLMRIESTVILHKQPDIKVIRTEVDKAQESLRYISNIIDDFGKFYQEGEIREHFALQKCVHDALGILLGALENHGVNVGVEGEENVSVHGYYGQCIQTISAILTNAMEIFHIRQVENPHIHISIYRRGDYGIVEITDNGGGMAAKSLSHIFDPYFSEGKTERNSGIGLFLAKVMIETNMQGKLTAENGKLGLKIRIELRL